MTIKTRLSALENDTVNVQNPDPDEVKMAITNEAELTLHATAKEILEQYRNDLEDFENGIDGPIEPKLNESQQAVVDQSQKLLMARAQQIFDATIATLIHQNNPLARYLFYSRFFWFIHDAITACQQIIDEDMVTSAEDFFTICHGEQDRRLKPVYDNWVHDLFTDASFERYLAKYHPAKTKEQLEKDFTAYLAKRTPEQAEKDALAEKQEEEENAVFEAQDQRVLKEKCPGCPDKCDWYRKNQVIPDDNTHFTGI